MHYTSAIKTTREHDRTANLDRLAIMTTVSDPIAVFQAVTRYCTMPTVLFLVHLRLWAIRDISQVSHYVTLFLKVECGRFGLFGIWNNWICV